MGTQGDSFFATFSSTTACVTAALEMQLELDGNDWPGEERPRVRMGLHTGKASEASTGLVGYEVHRAARIAAVGHGGQILLSSAAAGLVEDSLPANVSLRSLGSHRLKDLGRPESLFQLEAPGLSNDFAPLRSLDNPELPNNLPASLSPFVGRVDDLAEVRNLVRDRRLVTLTGAGGSGKTRLALQAAAEMLDGSGEGVWFIELASINDSENVAGAVIDSMRIRHETTRSSIDELLHVLRDQSVLLVLDNCEHVVDVVAKLVDLIGRHCPKVRLVTTSREPIGVDGEQVYRVKSLSLPTHEVETKEDLLGSDSVDLFITRAHLHNSEFVIDDASAPYIASICRRLDGIPLAIELAAARLASMSLQDLSRRLDQRFRLLTGGSRSALPRQQTLGAMVAWSYDLLTEPERRILRRLSVFANGFDLDAAETVCAGGEVDSFDIPGMVGSLVNKNLVLAERSSQALRYRLLETIRQYAAEQLLQSDGEEQAMDLRNSHANYFLIKSESIAPDLIYGPTKVQLLELIDVEWANVLAAFETMAEDPEGSSRILRLGVAIGPYLDARYLRGPVPLMISSLHAYGRRDLLRARALYWIPRLGPNVVEQDKRDEQLRRDLAMSSEANELAWELGDHELATASLGLQAVFTSNYGNKELALEFAESALKTAREYDLTWCIAAALMVKGGIQCFHGSSQRTRSFNSEGVPTLEEAVDWFRRAQDPVWLGRTLNSLSVASTADDDLPRARILKQESLQIAEATGDAIMNFYTVSDLSHLNFVLGEPELAETQARRSLMLLRRLGLPGWQSVFTINTLACCAAASLDFERAALLLGGVRKMDRLNPEHSGFVWAGSEERAHDDAEALSRAALGDANFKQRLDEGEAMSYEELTNLALRRPTSVA